MARQQARELELRQEILGLNILTEICSTDTTHRYSKGYHPEIVSDVHMRVCVKIVCEK